MAKTKASQKAAVKAVAKVAAKAVAAKNKAQAKAATVSAVAKAAARTREAAHPPQEPAPAASKTRKTPVDTPSVRPAKKAKDSQPDFPITWENFEKVKAHFGISDDECEAALVTILGPNPAGQKFWQTFKKKPSQPEPTDTLPDASSKAAEVEAGEVGEDEGSAGGADEEGEEEGEEEGGEENGVDDEDEEMPADIGAAGWDGGSDEDLDGEEIACLGGGGGGKPDSPSPPASVVEGSGGGSVADMLDTLPYEPEEPVRLMVPTEDPAKDARKDLEKALKNKPTPAKNDSKQARYGRFFKRSCKCKMILACGL